MRDFKTFKELMFEAYSAGANKINEITDPKGPPLNPEDTEYSFEKWFNKYYPSDKK